MSLKNLKKGSALVLVFYFVGAFLFVWLAKEQMHFKDESTDMVTQASHVGELVQGVELQQPISTKGDEVRGISFLVSPFERTNTSRIVLQLRDESGTILTEAEIDASQFYETTSCDVFFEQPVPLEKEKHYSLVLFSPDALPGNAITVWYGNTMPVSRAEIVMDIAEEEKLTINGQSVDGILCYKLHIREHFLFGDIYWYLVLAGGMLLAGYAMYLIYMAKKERSTLVLRVLAAFLRYRYLMRQLITRDFKTKYKRSVLGVLWSFLNPLLTMLVQYLVFSTLFKTDIENFPLYLLAGIICFNFFNEACGMALQSIVSNASLIAKVYVPKYVYPLSRVLSSTVNLLLSMIPLFLVMLVTGTPLRPAILLLPFGLICLVVFCIGVGFVLSTAMVFFRDTQFLWGVVSLLWMYITPLFYPVSIIPEKFMTLYKCNPLYHIIRFWRVILIDGVSPQPMDYMLCLIVSFVPLVIGAIIFKKNQDKFILNL